MSFRLKTTNTIFNMKDIVKGATTIINPNSMIMLSSGLAVTADSSATQLAFTKAGAESGVTTVSVVADREALFKGAGSANYTQAYFGTAYDLGDSADGTDFVNFSGTAKATLKVTDGTLSTPLDVEFRIAKHILY